MPELTVGKGYQNLLGKVLVKGCQNLLWVRMQEFTLDGDARIYLMLVRDAGRDAKIYLG